MCGLVLYLDENSNTILIVDIAFWLINSASPLQSSESQKERGFKEVHCSGIRPRNPHFSQRCRGAIILVWCSSSEKPHLRIPTHFMSVRTSRYFISFILENTLLCHSIQANVYQTEILIKGRSNELVYYSD